MQIRRLAPSLLMLLALVAGPGAGRAEPSADDQEACTPDVFKLCSSAIPNEDAIVACLNAKAAQLTPACRRVIDPPRPKATRRAKHARGYRILAPRRSATPTASAMLSTKVADSGRKPS